jgi:hypothetical protein
MLTTNFDLSTYGIQTRRPVPAPDGPTHALGSARAAGVGFVGAPFFCCKSKVGCQTIAAGGIWIGRSCCPRWACQLLLWAAMASRACRECLIWAPHGHVVLWSRCRRTSGASGADHFHAGRRLSSRRGKVDHGHRSSSIFEGRIDRGSSPETLITGLCGDRQSTSGASYLSSLIERELARIDE